MNSANKNSKDYRAAGFMNIKQVVCVHSNWFAEFKTGMMIGDFIWHYYC